MRTHKKGVDQIYHASKPNNGASRSCEETTHIKVIGCLSINSMPACRITARLLGDAKKPACGPDGAITVHSLYESTFRACRYSANSESPVLCPYIPDELARLF
jgi:hypothetical protein